MKKNIPLSILELLQPLADEFKDLIAVVKTEDAVFHFIDNDPNSDLFFKIVKLDIKNGKHGYIVEYKPKNKYETILANTWIKHEEIVGNLKHWISIIQGYNKIQTIYDDPILKSNQERFEKQFEILDEDADTVTFNLEQQLFLDQYLDNVKSKIIHLKEGRSENEINELSELEKEVTLIQKDLTKQSKRKIIQMLTKLWAKSQKIGLDVIKEIFVSVTAELAKKLLTGS
jgi:hypothetical protein